MNTITEFIVGKYYNNYNLYKSLQIQNVGGIRPKIVAGQVQFIVLTTSNDAVDISFSRNPYADRIENGFLVYTAAGLAGDQELSGVNKRIVQQYTQLFPIFGFINEGSSKGRRFLGLLELVRHYRETQTDGKRNLRQAWIFEFRIHENPRVIPLEYADSINASLINEARSQLVNEERGEIRFIEADDQFSRIANENKAKYITLENLRSTLMTVNPYDFELLLKDTIERNGFHNVKVTQKSGDGGIDVLAHFDDHHYFAPNIAVQFQAKRWKHSVGRKEVAELRGSLEAPFGVLVTTSHFTSQAKQESLQIGQKPIVLVDGIRFAEIIMSLYVPLEKYVGEQK